MVVVVVVVVMMVVVYWEHCDDDAYQELSPGQEGSLDGFWWNSLERRGQDTQWRLLGIQARKHLPRGEPLVSFTPRVNKSHNGGWDTKKDNFSANTKVSLR